MSRPRTPKPVPPRPTGAREAARLAEASAELGRALDRLRDMVWTQRRARGLIQLADRAWAVPPDPTFVGPPHPSLTGDSPGMTQVLWPGLRE